MAALRVELSDRALERASADLVAIAVSAEDLRALRRHREAGPPVLRELERRRFTAAEGSSVLLPAGAGAKRRPLAVIGLGPAAAIGRESLRRAGDQLVARAREARAASAAIEVVLPRGHRARGGGTRAASVAASEAELIAALVEGVGLASYAFSEYRHDRDRVALASLQVSGIAAPRDPILRREVRTAELLVRATNEARTWINQPATVMTPAVLAAEAERVGRRAGLEVDVAGPKKIRALGMGALAAVSRGSDEEPRFIRMRYSPRDGGKDVRRRRRIALVGKGITFDSGGLSLKRPDGMEHMKRDMAGGAAVIAAMTAIAALRPAIDVHAYVPASENMPSGTAMKPGDVVRTVSGKTVEILNTDAEGRLVLADALGVALADEPDAVVDIATLTGAVRSALGTRVGGILGNDRALVDAVVAAGARSGERLWELPLVRAYRDDLDSTVADLRNVAAEGYGGAIHAALFLEEFVGGRPWAHLDVAGVAFTDRDLPYTPRGAVGFGVRLLTRYVLAASHEPMATQDDGARPAARRQRAARRDAVEAGATSPGRRQARDLGNERKRSFRSRNRRS